MKYAERDFTVALNRLFPILAVLFREDLLWELVPSFGTPLVWVEGEGAQGLAGLSLSSLQWEDRNACAADQNQSKGVTACWPLGCHGLTAYWCASVEVLCCF